MDSYLTLQTGPLPVYGVSGYFIYYYVLKNLVYDANSVDPDQAQHSAASGSMLFANVLSKGH